MTKKVKLSFLMILTSCLVILTGIVANAVATSATVSVVVTQDNAAKTVVSDLTATIADAAGNVVTGVTADTTKAGTYTFANIASKGTYYITLAKSPNKLTIPVAVAGFGTKTVNTVWVESGKLTANKSGVLGGLTVDNSGTSLPGVTVKACNSIGYIWETVSDSNGEYKLYLPAGRYTLVVLGKDDATNDYKNIITDVTVNAGQMSGPMIDQNAQISWGSDKTMGLTVTNLTSDSKDIKGSANSECLVSAYVAALDTNNKVTGFKTFLGSTKVSRGAGTATTGSFDIRLPDYQMDNTIAVVVTDKASNTYTTTSAIAARDITLKATDSTRATVVNDVNVILSDKDSTAMTTYLTSNITSVSVKDSTGAAVTALKSSDPTKSDYKIANGKLTFKAGLLGTVGTYSIAVTANGYNNGTVLQTVGSSTTPAPGLNGTYSVAPGSIVGSTKFTSIGSPAPGNSLKYTVTVASTSTQSLLCKGNVLAASNDLKKDADIKNVDSTLNKYIDIYEVTTGGLVVGAKRVTLVAANILGPSIIDASVVDNTLTLTSDTTLDTTIPATAAFVVKVNGNNLPINAIAINGKTLTLTLTSEPFGGTIVTVDYLAPPTNPLKDAGGNLVAQFKSKAVKNNNIPTGGWQAISGKGTAAGSTAITITAGTAGNTLAYKVSATAIAAPNKGDSVTGITAYTSGADIAGVSLTNKYVAMYELDSSGKIANFILVTLDSSGIR